MKEERKDRVFCISRENYAAELKDIEAEMCEAHPEENGVLPPYYRIDAIRLAVALRDYALRHTEEYHTTAFMLATLAAAAECGEGRLILDEENYRGESRSEDQWLVNPDRKAMLMILRYAGGLVEYHYRVYSRGEDSAENRKKTAEAWRKLCARAPFTAGKEKSEEPVPGVQEIYDHLTARVVGQEEALKVLSMDVYRYLRFGERRATLLMGPSGCGKTHTIRTLFDLPYIRKNLVTMRMDVSGMTSAGFRGGDLPEILKVYKKKQGYGKESRGIIYLDEFDKIIYPNYDGEGDNVNSHVQSQMLSMLEGEEVEGVDTGKILFVLGGAFVRLEDLRKRRSQTRGRMGFQAEEPRDLPGSEDIMIRSDIIEAGGIRELVGRIDHILPIRRLSREDLKGILLHENGAIARVTEMYRKDGLQVVFEEDAIDAIVDRVQAENLGARSVGHIVDAILGTAAFDMIGRGYRRVTVTRDCVLGEAPLRFDREEDASESAHGRR